MPLLNILQNIAYSNSTSYYWNDFIIEIEIKGGDIRSGTSQSGFQWQKIIPFSYGCIKNVIGKDNEEVDVVIGYDFFRNLSTTYSFIISIKNELNQLDEEKVFIGFPNGTIAKKAFYDFYTDKADDLFMSISKPLTYDELKDYLLK